MNIKELAKIGLAVIVALAVFQYIVDPMIQKSMNNA